MKAAGALVNNAAANPGALTARPSAILLQRCAWWGTLSGLCAVLLAPLLIVDVPPLVDYPNHLARAFILKSLPADPVLATFYAAHWAIIPNLATDLIAPPMMRLLPVHDVGRLLIAAAVLLPVLGSVAYSTALGGRWWCLAVGLTAYNRTLMQGFLNFNLSIGIALLLAACWLRWRETRPVATIIVNTAGAMVLFACHLMGLLFYAALLGSVELFRLLHDCPPRPISRRLTMLPRMMAGRAAVLLLIFAAPAALYLASPLHALGGDAQFLSPVDKLIQLMAPFTNYSLTLDIITTVATLGFPCVCLVLRKGHMPGPAALATGGILLAYLAAPYAWKATSQLDMRLAIMLGFMLFAGFCPVRWPLWLRRTTAVVVGLLFIARMALLTTAWTQHRADLADLRRALAPLLPGQAVYVVSVRPTNPTLYWAHAPWSRRLSNGVQTDPHLGALAVIERRVWWPFEFDVPSQQPIKTKEPYRSLAMRIGDLPNQTDVLTADLCGFDAVLLMQADAAPELPEGRFHLLVRGSFAALYAIDMCRPSS